MARRSQGDHGESWLLYVGMFPTVLDGVSTDVLPCLLCHHHCLKEIDFVYILLSSIVLVNNTAAEFGVYTVVDIERYDW